MAAAMNFDSLENEENNDGSRSRHRPHGSRKEAVQNSTACGLLCLQRIGMP